MKNYLIDTEICTNAIKCIKNNSIKSLCFCCNYLKAAQNRDIFNLKRFPAEGLKVLMFSVLSFPNGYVK